MEVNPRPLVKTSQLYYFGLWEHVNITNTISNLVNVSIVRTLSMARSCVFVKRHGQYTIRYW